MSMYKPTFRQDLLQRIETKAISLAIAFVFGIAGFVMIYSDLRDDGIIHLKAAIVEGELQTGSIGVIVLFLATLIVLSCVWRGSKPHAFEVRKGDFTFKWTGRVGSLDHKLIARLQDVVNELQKQDCVAKKQQK